MDSEEFNKNLSELLIRYAKENGQVITQINVTWYPCTPMNQSLSTLSGSANISIEDDLLSSPKE